VEQSGAKAVFRGNHAAKIDDKGRLKIPNAFRSLIEAEHGSELFVTSLTGDEVRIYPMPVWIALEERLAQMPSTHPARLRFLDRVNYFGQMAEIDAQGRVVIPSRLRESAGMAGEVDVLGQYDRLDVWNHDRFVARLHREPYTDDDARALSQFGV
jgi:MraZ protein